jgi:uncharacterized protein involved in exopolysaccharide biosynthesis
MADDDAMLEGDEGTESAQRVRRRRKRIRRFAICGTIVVAGLVLAVLQPWVPRYSASVLLEVKALPQRIIFRTADNTPVDPRGDFALFQKTQEQLIKSRLVLKSAINRVKKLESLRGHDDPVEWLEQQLELKYFGEVLVLTISGGDPRDIVMLVNAVADAYLDEVVSREQSVRLVKLESLKSTYDDHLKRCSDRERVLQELTALDGNIGTTASDRQRAEEDLALCDRETLHVQADRTTAELKLSRRQTRKDPDEATRKAIADLEEEVAVLNAQEKFWERQRARLVEQTRAGARRNIDIRMLQREIDSARRALEPLSEEIEAMKIEISAPSRVRLMERAEIARPQ